MGQTELRALLANYQEELHETDPDLLVGPPERYLTQWADAGWLQRFLESTSMEPQFQLTRHAEDALRFLDSTLTSEGGQVGTESRLRLVIETLEDIVRGASADPQRRLNYLHEQRAAIDAEIEAIESGKSVQVYRPSQIRERFQTAVGLLKDLQSDFRAVEEHFQTIARDVQQRQSAGSDSRGGILGYALDAEAMLKTQDEGISFFASLPSCFRRPASGVTKSIVEIQQLAALADQQESLARVRRMIPSLLAEADKVMRRSRGFLPPFDGCLMPRGGPSPAAVECPPRYSTGSIAARGGTRRTSDSTGDRCGARYRLAHGPNVLECFPVVLRNR